ncbi:MAG: F0F1 ATP synthase subunit B family protein, partial [Methylobacter sp.]
MEFNLSTFVFEIINFLILIWILQRLFYKPLLEVIERRKQFIDQSLSDAKNLKQQGEEQCSRYENRQKLWEEEKQAAITALHRQLEAERRTHLDRLNADLERERQ